MNTGRIFGALILIVLGLLLLAGNFGIFLFRWDMLWPLMLILFGIWFIYRAFVPREHFHDVDVFAGVGESRPNLTGKEIHQEEFSHGIGEFNLDLTRATIPDGESTVKVSNGMGELNVIVPRDLAVRVQANSGMGDVELFDQRESGISPHLGFQSDDYATASRKLNLQANVGMGKVRVVRGS
ncbi:Protein LiaF [Anaerolineae bacterium]|nr:Protein LiaF [Anaerolineae bacterium]